MDTYANFTLWCDLCKIEYKPKIQAGTVMRVCPNCKNISNQYRLEAD